MKKISYILLLALTALCACDEVSPDSRLTYVEPPEVKRAVLIEDFTGQHCANCPRATEEIERLIEEYGDSVVIAVAIHSGPFSKGMDGELTPLYTEVGDEYFKRWNLSSQPVGLVDRIFGPMALNYTDWGGGVNYELAYEAPVAFVVSTNYDDETRLASIDVQTIGIDSGYVSGKLQVWLTEDSIDSFQYMPDGSKNEHYNHMHVFRASVNDPWGDDINVGHGEVVRKTYDIKLNQEWVPRHCAVVTFLYDNDGVRHVAKQALKN